MNAVTQSDPFSVGRVEKPRDFPAMLTAWLPEIQRALPKHLSAERISRIALTAFRRNPKLAKCEPKSVFAAVIQSSQLGLEIDTLGRAYLVPYDRKQKTEQGWKTITECQFIPGWKGLVDLMNRSGQGTVWTGAVFEGDEFDWQLGDSPFVRHIPRGENDPARLTFTYSVGRIKGSDWPIIEVWPIAKVWKHRDRYNKVGEKHYSYENQEMYARKVPLMQVLKYMPCSAELSTAMAMNDAAEAGHQGLDVKDAIAGSWTPPEEIEVAGEEVREEPEREHDGKPPSQAQRLREAAARTAAGKGGADEELQRGAPVEVTLHAVLGYIEKAKSADQADLALDMGRDLPPEQLAKAKAARDSRFPVKE